MIKTAEKIANQFQFEGDILSIKPFGWWAY